MNILSIPYFAGGLSHLIPLYVLHIKYLKNNPSIKNYFLINDNIRGFVKMQGIDCVSIDYFDEDKINQFTSHNGLKKINKYIIEKEKEAYKKIKPTVIIEDNSFYTPLIAEKNNVPRISIQRTGIFRSIDEKYRNNNHVHSMQKGFYTERSSFLSDLNQLDAFKFNDLDTTLLKNYVKPKVKVIPGIPSIECLPLNIDKESYFYSGPLIIMDKPSANLLERISDFLYINKGKPIIFITTGTIDKTPIENYIEYFVKRNYAVITTCKCEINEVYKKEIFYNKLLPLHYICGISNLVIHQCGSGMYHYPIINRVPSLTLGTLCYDREDIAQRLQQLGVSGHIPHPDDNENYWNIFVELINRFENNELVNFEMLDLLREEIEKTTSNFSMQDVIEFAIS